MWYSGLERWYPLRYTETLRHHVRHLVATLTMCLGGIWKVRDHQRMQEDGVTSSAWLPTFASVGA